MLSNNKMLLCFTHDPIRNGRSEGSITVQYCTVLYGSDSCVWYYMGAEEWSPPRAAVGWQ